MMIEQMPIDKIYPDTAPGCIIFVLEKTLYNQFNNNCCPLKAKPIVNQPAATGAAAPSNTN